MSIIDTLLLPKILYYSYNNNKKFFIKFSEEFSFGKTKRELNIIKERIIGEISEIFQKEIQFNLDDELENTKISRYIIGIAKQIGDLYSYVSFHIPYYHEDRVVENIFYFRDENLYSFDIEITEKINKLIEEDEEVKLLSELIDLNNGRVDDSLMYYLSDDEMEKAENAISKVVELAVETLEDCINDMTNYNTSDIINFANETGVISLI